MANGQPGTGALDRVRRWSRHAPATLLAMCRRVGSVLEDGPGVSRATTSSSACPGVTPAGGVLGYVRNPLRSLALFALLCATLMPNGDTRIHQLPNSGGVTRVMIVDDHPVLRRGLRVSLSAFPDLEVIGEAGSGEEALRLVEQVRPDVILMDIVMPGMGGISAIRALRESAPDTKIMVLSTYEEGDLVQEALQAGALAYQLKGVTIDELVHAIRQVMSGIPSLAPEATQSLIRATRAARQLGDDLTNREREVLKLLAMGLSNSAIAEQMVVTVATVKFHLRSIRSKLGTKTRTETVAVALQNRLVPPVS